MFALATLITTLNANGLPLLEFDNERYRAHLTSAAFLGALPGTAVFFTLLRACRTLTFIKLVSLQCICHVALHSHN